MSKRKTKRWTCTYKGRPSKTDPCRKHSEPSWPDFDYRTWQWDEYELKLVNLHLPYNKKPKGKIATYTLTLTNILTGEVVHQVETHDWQTTVNRAKKTWLRDHTKPYITDGVRIDRVAAARTIKQADEAWEDVNI